MERFQRIFLTTVALLCALIVTFSSTRPANARVPESLCWDKAHLESSLGFQVGPCIEFADDVRTYRCREIVVGGHSLGHFARVFSAGDRILGVQCQEVENLDLPFETEYLRYGGTRFGFSEIKRPSSENGRWSVVEFPIADLGYYSNPRFCDAKVAFWWFHDGHLGVRVYDVDDRVTIHSEEAGAVRLETDDSGVLPAPVWNDDCSRVTFESVRSGRRFEFAF